MSRGSNLFLFQSEESIQGTPSVCHAGTPAVTASVALGTQSQQLLVLMPVQSMAVRGREHILFIHVPAWGILNISVELRAQWLPEHQDS